MNCDSIEYCLQQASLTLTQSDSARLEAELLLAEALGKPRSYLFAWPERVLKAETSTRFQALLQRRQQGEPLAYILGMREFWSLDIHVTPATLIPRVETELLVEQLLSQAQPQQRILDLGTGSGAIALALKHERASLQISASDVSAAALAVARANGSRLGLEIDWIESDWFGEIAPRRFDFIVSNPPYIASEDVHLSQGDLPFEPPQALASGRDGLDAIRQIIHEAPDYLAAAGWLWLEHGFDQASAVRDLMQQRGFTQVQSQRDLASIERISGGCLAANPV